MGDKENIQEIKDALSKFRSLLPETKKISDKTFHVFCEHFNNFDGFYKLDQMFDEQKLSNVQKHFLTSLFFHFSQIRESPEKNAELKKMVEEVYKHLGYNRADFADKDFNRRIYKYIMLKHKGI